VGGGGGVDAEPDSDDDQASLNQFLIETVGLESAARRRTLLAAFARAGTTLAALAASWERLRGGGAGPGAAATIWAETPPRARDPARASPTTVPFRHDDPETRAMLDRWGMRRGSDTSDLEDL
jgi:hypothetical protein